MINSKRFKKDIQDALQFLKDVSNKISNINETKWFSVIVYNKPHRIRLILTVSYSIMNQLNLKYLIFYKQRRKWREKTMKRRNTTAKITKINNLIGRSKKCYNSTLLLIWQLSWRKTMIKWCINFRRVPIAFISKL